MMITSNVPVQGAAINDNLGLLSGRPNLLRHLNQKAMNLLEMWPFETQWAWDDLRMCCVLLRLQLASDGEQIYFEPIAV